jgi:hypothetical protein
MLETLVFMAQLTVYIVVSIVLLVQMVNLYGMVLISWLECDIMPVATVVGTSTDRFDLKTVPEGYVVIRRMSYGDSLKRQKMSTKMTFGSTSDKKDFAGELDIDQEGVALWDFANCIVEHNLTDDREIPLDFKKPSDVRRLARPVGEEIGKLIDDVNNFEDDETVKN